MQIKIKQNCFSHTNQSKKPLSPAQLKAKIKNNQEPHSKSIKIQKEMTVMPIKRRQHQPSKSSIQTLEHKHYNSPNSGIVSHSKQRSINQFTFTQLLQKNSKNHPICSSGTSLLHIQRNQPIITSDYTRYRDCKMKKAPLTGRGLTKTSASLYYESNPIHIEMDLEDEIANNAQITEMQCRRQQNLSNNKSVSRSPIRLTNAHRLNNTPKVKQKGKKNKEGKLSKKQSKTFTSVLNSYSIEKSRHCKKESINLLCSEKIYKFIEDNPQEKDSKTDIISKHKSNLLSTGVINLSQPLERTEQSDNHANVNAEIKRIISGRQDIQEFDEQGMISQIEKPDIFRRNISELRQRVKDIRIYLTNKVEMHDQSSFCLKVGQSFNPQLNFRDISAVIAKLTQLSFDLQQSCQQIISKVHEYSTKFSQQINEQIKILEDSKRSLIDWTAVQKQMEEKHQIQQQLSRVQILSIRLENLSTSIQNVDCQKEIENEYVKELQAIDAQIQKQFFHLNLALNQSPSQSNCKEFIGQETVLYFRDKEKKIEALFSSIEEIITF